MKNRKILNFLTQTLCFFVCFVAAVYVLAPILWYIYYFVHEGGHIFFGFVSNLLVGEIPAINITNWVDYPPFPLSQVPQKTKIIGYISPIFAFGGIIAVISVSTFASLYFYKKTKNKIYFIFLALFMFYEVFGSFLCGTDNFQGKPFELCKSKFPIDYWMDGLVNVFRLLTAVVIYPKALPYFEKAKIRIGTHFFS